MNKVFLKKLKFVVFFTFYLSLPDVLFSKPQNALSQTESYLNALAPTRKQAFENIRRVLTAPTPDIFKLSWEEQKKARRDTEKFIRIDPKEYVQQIDEAIESEKKHPDCYVLYHGAQKESLLMHLFTTYFVQAEYGWARDDFFIFRLPSEFYKPKAETALDFIKQNTAPNKQTGVLFNYDILKQFVQLPDGARIQFDMIDPIRTQILSTSIAFVSGVDDTDMTIREMSDQDYPAWESSFYYFATNLSWSDIDRLYGIIIGKLKNINKELFENTTVSSLVRKYIALRFSGIPSLFQPLVKEKDQNKDEQIKAGIMFQIFIPKNIIDDVAYLSWQNGAVWQHKIDDITDGWDDSLGIYSKISTILDVLQKNPKQLGSSINLLQARLIFKDEKYLFSPNSPIKMNLITSLPKSLIRSLQDILKSLANVAFEFKQAVTKKNLEDWVEKINLEKEVKRFEDKMKAQLNNPNPKTQILGLKALKYLVMVGEGIDLARSEEGRLSNSSNNDVKRLCNEINGLIKNLKK